MSEFKETIRQLKELKKHCKSMKIIDECTDFEAEPSCAQIKLERDTAIKQLESYGVKFCENAEVKKVVYARWEINCDGYYPYCSNCKSEPQGRVMTKYCPNCGAKMEGE